MLTKKQVTDIAFSLRTHAAKCNLYTAPDQVAALTTIRRAKMAMRQSLNFTSKAKPFWMA